VVTDNGGFPCGVCRQMLYEFSPLMMVIVADAEGNIISETTLADLLPRGFSPDQVPKHGTS
jgi:cytidine deaminase